MFPAPASNLTRALLLLVCLLTLSVAQAQSPGGSGSSPASPTGQRPTDTGVGFLELLESGSQAFLALFRDDPGMPKVGKPHWESQHSPREALMTFEEAMWHVSQGRTEAWPRAMGLLPNGTKEDARNIFATMERLPELASDSLPSKEIVDREKITRFELFPRGIESNFAYKALSKPPAGAIAVELKDGKWVFDQNTIAGAKDLLESMKGLPPRARIKQRGNLFLNTVTPTFTQTKWWDWLKALGWLAGAFFLSYLIGKALTKAADKVENVDDFILAPLLRGLALPLISLVITIGLLAASGHIYMEPAISTMRWSLLKLCFLFGFIWLLVSIVELAIISIQRAVAGPDNPYAKMLSTVIRRIVRIAASVIIGLFFLQNVMDVNLSAILGGVGILALAVSLAAKDAVANLFGALTVFANRPFVANDWVRFEGQIGVVEDVSVQVTRIRLISGELWSVPNMRFVDHPVENLSERRYLRRITEIAITYDTPREKVEEAIEIVREVLSTDPVCEDGQCDPDKFPPLVEFVSFASDYLALRMDYRYLFETDEGKIQRETERSYLTFLSHCTVVNLAILEKLNKAGIDFAFPTQTIKLDKVS